MSHIVIVMGVSGCGKTSVARALSANLGWGFIEADDFHDDAAREQMAKGIGLTDAQREPWIMRLCQSLTDALSTSKSTVLACSALRKAHRDMFRAAIPGLTFVYLDASETLIHARLSMRQGHFAKADLAKSQFAALEVPTGESGVVQIDADQGFTDVVQSAVEGLEKELSEHCM